MKNLYVLNHSQPLLGTLLMHLWQQLQPPSFWIWCYKLSTRAAPFPSGWRGSVGVQISPEMFNWIQVWTLAGPFKDIHRDVLKTFFWYLGLCVHGRCPAERWTSPRSEVNRALGAGFHSGCLCTLLYLSFPLCWLVSRFLPLKNIPRAWYCHHHASLSGW